MPELTEATGDDRVKEAYERARDFYLSQPLPDPEIARWTWWQITGWPPRSRGHR